MLESISTIKVFRSCRVSSVALATVTLVVLSAVALVSVAGPAQAAFPGGPNGTIIFECQGTFEDLNEQDVGTEGTYYDAVKDASFRSNDICAMNADGSDQKRLTVTRGQEENPVWSPGFDKIAFACTSRDGAGDKDICVMNADGTGERLVTSNGTNPNNAKEDYESSWSPDGKKLAFTSNRGGYPGIYTMNADGTDVTALSNPAHLEQDPAWSPDGTKIAFSSYRTYKNGQLAEQEGIYVMDADGTNQTSVVTDHAGGVATPAWSPDGTKIAYMGTSEPWLYGTWWKDVFVVDPDGSDKRNLTLKEGTHHVLSDGTIVQTNSENPAWSPDGKQVVFDYAVGLDTINVDGTNRQKLPKCGYPMRHDTPDWGVGSVSNGYNCGSLTGSDTSPTDGGDTSAPNAPTLGFGGSGTVTNDTTPTFGGTAEPGSTIKLYDGGAEGGTLLGEVTAGGDGKWEYTLVEPLGEGTHSITATATDTSGNTSGESAALELTIDTTGPSVSVPQNLAPFEAKDPKGAVVTYEASSTDAVDGSVKVSCDPPSGSTFPIGNTTVTCKATDAAGNTSTATFTVTVQDKTSPVISGVPSDVTKAPTGTSGAVVTYTPPTSTDAVDGAVSVRCEPPSGSAFPIGTTTVTCTATDAAGNTSTATFKVSILYAFGGFLQPVDTLPTINVAKAGSGIPVKFSIGGDYGLNIFETGYPKVQPCPSASATGTDAIEQTVSVSTSALKFDAQNNQYSYLWKTEKGWVGSCKQLVLKFNDGTEQKANFSFK